MSRAKVAVIGAGSYVFGPSVIHDVLIDHQLGDIHVAMMDLDQRMVDVIAAAGRRIASDLGLGATFTGHTDRVPVLDGADFVICSASRQMRQRFQADLGIIARLAPNHVVTEFGGIQGISYSLRQIALIEELAADIRKHCPNAWLLDVANPLPRVCQAAYESGVKTVGLCSASLDAFGLLWHVFHGHNPRYPFAEPRRLWELTMAGTNHFSFLLGFKEIATGRDLMPALRDKLAAGASTGEKLIDQIWRSTGYMPTSADDHVRDFVSPSPLVHAAEEAWHGTETQREDRIAALVQIGEGKASWKELMSRSCWEKPIDIVAAMAFDKPGFALSLNLINDRSITNLPRNIFVETPCRLSRQGPAPLTVTLPAEVLPLSQSAAAVTDAIVAAARGRNRRSLYRAIDLDPTILDKKAARLAIDACLAAHADILPVYS